MRTEAAIRRKIRELEKRVNEGLPVLAPRATAKRLRNAEDRNMAAWGATWFRYGLLYALGDERKADG